MFKKQTRDRTTTFDPLFARGEKESVQHVALESYCVLGIEVELGVVSAGIHFAPDLDVGADLAAHADKGFHDDGALIMDVAQSFADFAPGGAAAAGYAAIAFAGMEMAEVLAGLADGATDAVFFDVHVEGVEHDLDPRVVDFLDKLDGFLGGIEEITLETVENLEAIVHATGICDPGQSFPVA